MIALALMFAATAPVGPNASDESAIVHKFITAVVSKSASAWRAYAYDDASFTIQKDYEIPSRGLPIPKIRDVVNSSCKFTVSAYELGVYYAVVASCPGVKLPLQMRAFLNDHKVMLVDYIYYTKVPRVLLPMPRQKN